MAREKNVARKLSLINPDSEDRLSGGDAHGIARDALSAEPIEPGGPAATDAVPQLGDLALVAYGSDTGGKGFAFVLLADLSGEVIHITDNGWTAAGAFRANEGTISITIPAGLPIGTVIRVTGLEPSPVPVVTTSTGLTLSAGSYTLSGSMNPATGGDQYLVYRGTAASPTFLFAVDFADLNSTYAGDSTTAATSAVPTGLTFGTNALAFPTDNAAYTGPLSGTRQVILSNIANAANWTIDDSAFPPSPGTFTVLQPGALAIDDVTLNEGNSGTTTFTFTVTRSGGSDGAVGATWTISFPGGAGGANSGDLAAGQLLTGTVSFADGDTSETITVNVNGDYFPEDTETFNVTLSAATGGATISDSTGVGTITNDDFPGAISIDDVSHMEGDGGTTLYTFTVSRTGQAANTSVQWAVSAPGGAGNAGETDFLANGTLSGTITFAAGETSRTITVSVLGDHLYEPDESFTVTLSNPSPGATIADGTGAGTILTDDAAPPFTPDGNEVTVNQNIDQDQVGPRVAWIDAGHYVVTWTSHETPTSYEVMARLFNADGTPAGDEFQVNTTSVGDQVGNRVAALSGGGFVIVWSDVTTTDIRARMFNADGTPDGIELLLNTDPNAQSVPWVSALPGGGFAAVWMHNDGVSYDIRGRTFDAAGLPVSAEFAVNTNTALNQQYAQMTTLANGHFVVVWHDAGGVGGDASSTAIKMRVFDTDGTALTAETLVNTTIAGMQQFPAVGALVGGGYVVAWEDYSASGGDTSGNALRAQIYDAAGNAVGSEFIVNFTTEGDQSRPTVTGLPDGGFVVGWWNQANGVSVNEVRAQAFDALGNRRGGEFEVNSNSAGDQLGAAFAASPVNGHLVATWTDYNDSQELTDGEIEQRLFSLDPPPSLTLGNLVFRDTNANGVFDTGIDSGIVGVTVQLLDATGSFLFDTTVTDGNGLYSFAGLSAGDYVVRVVGSSLPSGYTSVPGAAGDPDDDIDNDDNGAPSGADYVSQAVTLTEGGEPTDDGDADADTNLSVDFGFVAPAVVEAPTVDLNGPVDGTGFTGAYTEGGAGSPIGTDIAVTAPNLPITSATITITDAFAGDALTVSGTLPATIVVASGAGTAELSLTGTGTPAEWAAALSLVRYASGSDNPTEIDGERNIEIVVSDGVGSSVPALAVITITPVDDAPELINFNGDAVTFTEGDPYVLLDTNLPAAITDPDSPDFGGGSFSIGVQINPAAEDEFFILNAGPVGTLGNDVYVEGELIGTITSSGPGQLLTIAFNTEATPALVAELIDYIGYRNVAGDNPSAGPRSVSYLLNDGDGAATAGVVTVTVAAVNDAPVVTTTPGTTVYVESVNAAPGTTAVNPALTVTDADDTALAGATVWISNNFQAGQDILAFSNTNGATFGNIAASYDFSIGVLTLTSSGGTATVAQWQAALRAVTYSNLSQEPSEAVRTIAFTVDDGEATGAAATRLLSVTAQNDSPAGADANVTILEDATFTFNAAHFGFSDIDGDAFFGVRFGAAPLGGTIYFDADGAGGAAAVAVTSFPTTTYSAADIAAGKLTFVPTANSNGTGAASVTFTVVDNGGTAGAGQNADVAPNTLTFDITSVNDAPSGADKIIDIVEDTPYTLTLADFGFSDVDGNAFEAVIFSHPVSGGTLYINGNPMNSATVVYVHTISSGDVVFVPAANATGAIGGITFQVRDDGGFDNGGSAFDQTPNVLSFLASAVNDGPVNSVPGAQTIDEDATQVFSTANGNALSVADADAITLTVTLAVGNGTLTLASTAGLGFDAGDGAGDATMTFSGTAAAINAALGAGLSYAPATNYNGGDTLAITTSDNGQTGSGGTLTDADTVAITINPVNDAPSGIDHVVTATEDTPKSLSAADFSFTDVENNGLASVTIVTLPGAGTLYYDADGPGGAGAPVAVLAGATFTPAQLGGARLTYVPAPNASGTGVASFTYSVRDNGGTANGGQDTDASPNTITINVTPVNDAPTSTGLDGDAAAYTEDSPAGVTWLDVGRDAVITDIDSADFTGGTLRVAIIVNKVAGEDQLVLSGDSNGVTISGNEVFVDGVSIGTISADGLGLDRLIALSDGATAERVSRVIQNFSYVNTNEATPSTALRLIEFRLTDGDGGTMSAYTSVTVSAVDDAPVIANFDNDDVTFVEGSAAIRVDLGGDALVSDVDSADFDGGYLQVILQEGTPSEDVVGFATSPETGITLSDGTSTGSIVSIDGVAIGTIVAGSPTATAFTVNFNANADAADVSALLQAITYLNTNTDNPSTQTRAIVVFVNDGDGAPHAGAVSHVHIDPVNDAPTSTGFDNVTFTEGMPYAQLDVGFDQVLTDVDSPNFAGGTLVFRVTGNKVGTEDGLGFLTGGTSFLSVSGNTLSYHGVAIATFSASGVGLDRTFTFNANATVEAVQTVMRNLVYYNANQADPSTAQRTIEYVLTDGDGGTLTLTSLVDVVAVNDAPSGTDAAFTVNEDSTFTFAESHFGFSDPAEGDEFLGVVIATTPSAGTILYDGVAVVAGQLVTLDDIALGKLTFVPAPDGNGEAYGSFTFQVRDDGGTLNGGQDTDQSANTLTFNVTAVNDAPTNSVPGATQTAPEDGSVTLSTANGNAISVADVDATTLTVTLSVAHGTLTLASTTGLTFSGGSDGTADATMTFSGTATDINAALGAGLTYTPTADYNGADAISVVTTDNGQTGTGPTGTDSDSIAIGITAINDAPVVIDATQSAPTILEDMPSTGFESTNLLFGASFSDTLDQQQSGGNPTGSVANDLHGVAIVANGSSGATGQWQYFNGLTWVDIGAASQSAAVFVHNGTSIRFTPAPDFNGDAPTLTAHLVDNSGASIGNGTIIDLSGLNATGGTTAYSSGTVVLSQTVTAVNDPPVLDLNGAADGTSVTLAYDENAPLTAIAPDATLTDIDTTNFNSAHLVVTMANGLNSEDLLEVINQGTGAGQIGYSGGIVTYEGVTIAIRMPVIGAPFPALDLQFVSGSVSPAAVQALLRAIGYSNSSQDPSTTPRNVTFELNDADGTANGGNGIGTATATINVTSVNDAPSGTDNSVTGSEDDPYVFTAADFGYSDLDADAFFAVQITTLPLNGDILLNGAAVMAGDFIAVSAINAGMLTFQPDPDTFNSPYATFTFRVQDDGGITNGGVDTDPVANTMTINVTEDNFPPVVDLDGATGGVNYTTTYVEDGAAAAIGSGVIVSDPNSGVGDMIESATIILTDRVAGDSLTLTGALPPGITAVTTPSAGAITITITGQGTGAQYQALIQSIQYATTGQDPTVGGTDLSRTITVTVNDGTIGSAVATTTVNVTAVDDAPVAQPDVFVITESGTIVGGDLFADHGSGADGDGDGPALSISAVGGGPGANIGTQFQLDSGALLTVRADGTFDYNPNGVFLRTPTPGSGASNTPAHDSFTYTLAGGNTVTVSIALTGLDTDDTLFGTGGADILAGGNGNDSYRVENTADLVLESAGAGYDGVYVAMHVGGYALAAGSEVEILAAIDPGSTAALNLTGNEYANAIIGSAGVNTLIGEGGNDILVGGGGNDFYRVETAGDIVVESAGGGFDSVYAVGSYTLAAGSEVELLSAIDPASTAGMTLIGNEFANFIYGNAGVNTLIGEGGNDTLIGGAGNDFYRVETAGDTVIENAGGGFDSVYAVGSYTLAAGSEVELLAAIDPASTAAMNLFGNEFANLIYGNAGSNTLIGDGGNDTLAGGAGNDFYRVEDAGDVVVENAGGGADSVYAVTSYALNAGAEVELLSAIDLGATTAMNLTGNEYAQTIIGNAGANTLIGGGGNDVMAGGGGNDTYRVEDGGDIVIENTGGGSDAVYTTTSYTLSAGYEIEILSTIDPSSTAAIDLTGNETSNTLFGNAGANMLDGKGGNDALVGGGGADIFAFTTALGAGNLDTITDFVAGTDKIALDDAVFTAIGGTLSANAFVTGSAATDADDRIVYNQATGQLFYDADGNGGGAAILFATLQGAPPLTAADFTMI